MAGVGAALLGAFITISSNKSRFTEYSATPKMRALDELLKSWRSNPDADATIAVCSYLGSSKRDELIREVGASAETWHSANADESKIKASYHKGILVVTVPLTAPQPEGRKIEIAVE